MANIIEHGPSGLVAAAQVMGAGAAGMTQGVMLGQEYQKKQLQIQQAQKDLEASQMQMDAYRRQQRLREQASSFLAQNGEAGQALLAFQDTGDTGIPGVKRNPLQMPPDLFQIWRQGDAETRELIQNEWAMMRGAADYQAITNHVRSQADDILNGRGVYGASENNPYMPQAAQAIEAVAPQVQEILEEMEAGLLSPQEANAQLNQIQSSLFDTVRNGQTKAAILGAFSAKIEQAYGFGQVQQGQGALLDFGSRDSGYAEYLQAMQKMYQDGHLTPTQAMAILKLNPNEYEALLQMGHGLAQQGGGQGQPYTGKGVNIQGPPEAEPASATTETAQFLETGETAAQMESRERALARRQRQAQSDEEARKAKVLTDSALSAESRMAGLDHKSRFGRALGMASRKGEVQEDIVRKWVDIARAGEVRDGETQEQALERYNSLVKELIGKDASKDEVWVAQALAEDLQQVLAGPREGNDLREILIEYGLSEQEADYRVAQELKKSPAPRLSEDAATRLMLNAKSYVLRRGPMTQQQIVEQSEREQSYAEHDEIAGRHKGQVSKVLRDDLTLEQAKKADRLLERYDKLMEKVRATKDYRGGIALEASKIAKQLKEMGVPVHQR